MTPPAHATATAVCFNGSSTDCNVPGATLTTSSAWVDPEPPPRFVQCAGFVNTAQDDVTADFLDHCLGASSLRVRVFTEGGALEEDTIVSDMPPIEAWPNFNYLGGELVGEKRTHWGTTSFFTTPDGTDACMKPAGRAGTTFGSGNANTAIVVGANTGADEYRINCGGEDLPGRRIGIYRLIGPAPTLQQAR